MMALVIDELDRKYILSTEQVTVLRDYIKNKYITYSNHYRAEIFSDAVHKILDRELYIFPTENRNVVKRQTLEDVVHKADFSIKGIDVFKAIVKTQLNDLMGYSLLKTWLKSNIEKTEIFDVEMILDEYLGINRWHKSHKSMFVESETKKSEKHLEPLLVQSQCQSLENTTMNFEAFTEKVQSRLSELKDTFLDVELRISLIYKTILPFMFTLIAVGLSVLVFGENITHTAIFQQMEGNEFPLRQKPSEVVNLTDAEYKSFLVNPKSIEISYTNTNTNAISNSKILRSEGSLIDYKVVSRSKLIIWLEQKESILAKEPYIDAILDTAETFNVNPLLLIAIIGQEQGFVNASSINATRIANNPYNIYGSWKKYNTNIYDSTAIVAKTILNISKERPLDVHPIKWLNTRYAEDPNWWKGVSSILLQIESALNF